MKNQIIALMAVSVFGSLMLSTSALSKEPNKEMRQQMAERHAKMAACLSSDKQMSECKGMMGKDGCSGMGSRMGGGMMGD